MMKIAKLNKKGTEIQAKYIIGAVIAIIAFLIILFLLVYLNLGGESNEEACTLSVLTRATSPEIGKTYVPLNCRTDKVCLAEKNGKCAGDFRGEKEVQVTELPSEADKSAREAEKAIADKMLECWNMFGQGKLSLINTGVKKYFGAEEQQVSCIICSRISIEHSKLNEITGTGGVNIKSYLQGTKAPGSDDTYMELMTDSRFSTYPDVKIDSSAAKAVTPTDFTETGGSEVAIVFSQIRVSKYEEVLGKLAGLGAGTLGGAIVMGGGSTVASLGNMLLSKKGLAIAGLAVGGVTAYTMYQTYQGREIAFGHCGKFASTEEMARQGCSLIHVLPYDARAINQMCNMIEGKP